MILIEDYNSYKQKVNEFRKKSQFSNCYFLPDQIKQKITHQKLYWEEVEDNLLIFEKEDNFYRLYYYLGSPELFKMPSMIESCVVEFSFRNKLLEKQLREINVLEQCGFSVGRESGRMVKKNDQFNNQKEFKCLDGIRICLATEEEIPSIMDILQESFNPLFAFLPTESELEKIIQNHYLYVLFEGGELVALINMDFIRGKAWIRHLAVKESARKKGYAYYLVKSYEQKFSADATEFMQWVDVNNSSAVKLYLKMGYQFDGMKAIEYVWALPANS